MTAQTLLAFVAVPIMTDQPSKTLAASARQGNNQRSTVGKLTRQDRADNIARLQALSEAGIKRTACSLCLAVSYHRHQLG